MEYQPSTILPPTQGNTKFGGTQSRIIMGGVNCQNVGTDYIPCIEIAGETTAQYGLKIAGTVVSRVTTANTNLYRVDNAYSFLNDNALPTGTVVATGVTGDPITYDAATGVLTGVTTTAFVAGAAYWCKEIIPVADGVTLYLYTKTTAGRDIKEVYDQVKTITSITGDINAAKVQLAQKITQKGVTTSPTDALSQMATNVGLIQHESYEIGESVTGEAIFPSEYMWNLITEAYAHVNGDYAALILCEFYKGYDTIPLSNADAYYTCDGDFYTAATTHTWHDDSLGKINRYVIYYFTNNGSNFNIASTSVCPYRMTVIGKIGSVICNVPGRIVNIYNQGTIKDLQWGSTQILCDTLTIFGIEEQNSGSLIYSNKVVKNAIIGVKKLNGGSIVGSIYNSSGTIVSLNMISLEVVNGGYILQNNSQFSSFTGLTELYANNLVSINGGGVIYCPINIASYDLDIEKIELKSLKNIINGFIFDGLSTYASLFSKFHLLKTINLCSLTNISGGICNYTGDFNSTPPELIDIEVGEMTTNLFCSFWNPTNVISDPTKLATLNANIRNHIAAKVSDRTGLSSLTFTVSTNLLNNLEQATIDAFTAKNWIVAGA